MLFLWIGLGAVALILAAVLGIAFYCYRSAFWFDRSIKKDPEAFDLPHGTVYEPFGEQKRNSSILSLGCVFARYG